VRASRRRGAISALGLLVVFAVAGGAEAPRFLLPAELSIEEGGIFPILVLDEYLASGALAATDLVWTASGLTELLATVVDGRAYFATPNTEWSGSETVVLQGCGPGGDCTASELVLRVDPVNDPPRLSLPSQIATTPGQPFDVFDLAGCTVDIDDESSALRWAVVGQTALGVAVEGSAMTVVPPGSGWIGSERLRIEVRDAAGARAADTVEFVVAPEGSLTLTLIRNAGFLIAAHGHRVLIDALYEAAEERFPDLVDAGSRFDADLVLATHSHPDHFDPSVVARYLESHPTASFVGPRDAAVRVIAEPPGINPGRVTGVVLERFEAAELVRSGIALTLFDLPHGGTPNVAYLIDLGGVAVFHTGDHTLSVESIATIARWGLRDRGIAVVLALPVHFSSASMFARLRDLFDAEAYAPMHVKPGSFGVLHRLAATRKDTIVLEEPLETWVRPPDGG
jgi:L-ascorbate metabolism protein UlaG (beta-lactamase superfamily)